MVGISGWIEGLKEKYWHFQEVAGDDYAKILFVGLTSHQKNDKSMKMLQKRAEN